MRKTAAWVHAMRATVAAELAGEEDNAAEAARALRPCPTCEGKAAGFGGSEGCGLCDGLGFVRGDSSGGCGKESGNTWEACEGPGDGSSSGGRAGDGTRSQGVPPELAEAWGVVGDCLAAWRAIETYGISDGLMALGGPEALAHGWHPVMLELVEELNQELSRLEHEDRKLEASRARKAREAAERRARLGRAVR